MAAAQSWPHPNGQMRVCSAWETTGKCPFGNLCLFYCPPRDGPLLLESGDSHLAVAKRPPVSGREYLHKLQCDWQSLNLSDMEIDADDIKNIHYSGGSTTSQHERNELLENKMRESKASNDSLEKVPISHVFFLNNLLIFTAITLSWRSFLRCQSY